MNADRVRQRGAIRRTVSRFVPPRVRSSRIWHIGRPRRLNAYCVGTPKSGTHSMAAMLNGHYRVAHEPWLQRSFEAILSSGIESHADMRKHSAVVDFVLRRDSTLWVEFESSHVPGHFLDVLVERFPEARFVLTVRDCCDWLNSMLNHYVNRYPDLAASQRPFHRTLQRFNEYRFRAQHFAHQPEDKVLATHGLYPVDAYLAYWTRHNLRVLTAVPEDRLLVVRTDRLGEEAGRIADFLGIPMAHVALDRSHEFRAPQDHALLRQIDPAFVEARAQRHCGELMARLSGLQS